MTTHLVEAALYFFRCSCEGSINSQRNRHRGRLQLDVRVRRSSFAHSLYALPMRLNAAAVMCDSCHCHTSYFSFAKIAHPTAERAQLRFASKKFSESRGRSAFSDFPSPKDDNFFGHLLPYSLSGACSLLHVKIKKFNNLKLHNYDSNNINIKRIYLPRFQKRSQKKFPLFTEHLSS